MTPTIGRSHHQPNNAMIIMSGRYGYSFSLLVALLLIQHLICTTNAFAIIGGKHSQMVARCVLSLSIHPILDNSVERLHGDKDLALSKTLLTRRNWLGVLVSSSTIVGSVTTGVLPSLADDEDAATKNLPLITVEELETLFKTAAKSILVVEFSGPRSDTVVVRLVDGVTRFGLSNVVESPTDPRSPLRVAALCREFKVPTKFTSIEAILAKSSTSSKRKLYTNDRVREAQVKEKEKKERMDQDEAERLVELFQYQQEQDRVR